MRVTPNKLSSGSLLALLTALLFLAPSGKTDAQSASRSFQMALYVELKAPNLTSADADISMFGEGQAQPPGRSVIKYKSWPTGPTLSINDRGGRAFSGRGVSGFLPVQYSNRRTEIHEETET
jgi:hypothetical protein